MRRLPSVLLPIALVAAPTAGLGAQACLGLPDRAHTSIAAGFEGTDGLSGYSAALMHARGRWGVQARVERYDDQPDLRGPWHGGELQASRALRRAAGGASRVCAVGAARYQVDAPDDERYDRLRLPVGLAFGREFGAAPMDDWASRLTIAPFVQPEILLQHERWRADADAPTVTRTRLAPSAVAGVGIGAGPMLLRSAVRYQALPQYTLNDRHNWFELTLQAGISF